MLQVSAGGTISFTGVLVQRQYKPGQKYIQLVFETAEGMRLSLSRNIQMVRNLHVGTAYDVKGQEYAVGNKLYVHDPVAVPARAVVKPSKKHKALFIIIAVVAGLIVAATAIFFLTGHRVHNSLADNKNTSGQQEPTSDTTPSPSSSLSSTPDSSPDTTAADDAALEAADSAATPKKTATPPANNTQVDDTPAAPVTPGASEQSAADQAQQNQAAIDADAAAAAAAADAAAADASKGDPATGDAGAGDPGDSADTGDAAATPAIPKP